jgi:hypothetical protein
MENEIEFKAKLAKSKLTANIQRVLPLIEEITDQKVLPLCLIGFSADKKGKVHAHLATISDDSATEAALFEICKKYVASRMGKGEQKNESETS